MKDIKYECGDGWRNLIDVTLDQVRATDHRIEIRQVKEKTGDLVIYYHPHNDRADKIIALAAEIASTSCEECGQPARIQKIGFVYKVLCAVHVKERKHR